MLCGGSGAPDAEPGRLQTDRGRRDYGAGAGQGLGESLAGAACQHAVPKGALSKGDRLLSKAGRG